MSVIDLTDPAEMAKAIESGLIWSAPAGAQEAACRLIAEGKVPMPAYVSPEAERRIRELRGGDLPSGPLTTGSGPA